MHTRTALRPSRLLRRAGFVTCLALLLTLMAGPGDASIGAAARGADAIEWKRVVTLQRVGPSDVRSVTTANGLVVAAWNGPGFHSLYVATRPAGGTWSEPITIPTTVPAFDLTKDGRGAWLVWQGFQTVTVARIDAHGRLGKQTPVGVSGDPFSGSPFIAAGADGSVAAAWVPHESPPAMIAYKPAGQGWQQAEQVPQAGYPQGLVLGSSGTAQFVMSEGEFSHQTLTYVRRSAGGAWRAPFVISGDATLSTVEGNAEGDLVVGWEIVHHDGTFGLAARYKASGDATFDDTHHFDEDVPSGSRVALGIAAHGSLAAAYRVSDSGGSQVQMTPADSTGVWLDPQDIGLTGGVYDVAMNSAGDFVVTSMSSEQGVQLVRCAASNVCSAAESNPATKSSFPSTSLGPDGTVTLVWARGGKDQECRPTKVVTQRGR